jgi:hypothetical protein
MVTAPSVIGGVIGAILILVLFDWLLIVLSSFSGASLIMHSMIPPRFNISVAFLILAII